MLLCMSMRQAYERHAYERQASYWSRLLMHLPMASVRALQCVCHAGGGGSPCISFHAEHDRPGSAQGLPCCNGAADKPGQAHAEAAGEGVPCAAADHAAQRWPGARGSSRSFSNTQRVSNCPAHATRCSVLFCRARRVPRTAADDAPQHRPGSVLIGRNMSGFQSYPNSRYVAVPRAGAASRAFMSLACGACASLTTQWSLPPSEDLLTIGNDLTVGNEFIFQYQHSLVARSLVACRATLTYASGRVSSIKTVLHNWDHCRPAPIV